MRFDQSEPIRGRLETTEKVRFYSVEKFEKFVLILFKEKLVNYLKSRYYSPEICRFLSPDGQLSFGTIYEVNLFAYCDNNPVNRIDPNGNAWYHWSLGAFVVGVFAAATVITCGGFAAAVSLSVWSQAVWRQLLQLQQLRLVHLLVLQRHMEQQ